MEANYTCNPGFRFRLIDGKRPMFKRAVNKPRCNEQGSLDPSDVGYPNDCESSKYAGGSIRARALVERIVSRRAIMQHFARAQPRALITRGFLASETDWPLIPMRIDCLRIGFLIGRNVSVSFVN